VRNSRVAQELLVSQERLFHGVSQLFGQSLQVFFYSIKHAAHRNCLTHITWRHNPKSQNIIHVKKLRQQISPAKGSRTSQWSFLLVFGPHDQKLQEFLQTLRTVEPAAPVSCLLHSKALCQEKDIISGLILKRLSIKMLCMVFLLLGRYAA